MEQDDSLQQLIDEVSALFNSKQSFNAPAPRHPIGALDNFLGSPGAYQAPIHGTWASSGGFTYQPNATHPTGHMGLDLRASGGTPVHSMALGIVSYVGTDPKGGNVVNITHANGIRTYYAHLSVVSVQKGDKVDTNSIIGAVGNSGNAKGGVNHLHFQVWKDNQIQDPARFFSVPQYTNPSAEEKRHGPWISERAKQQAQAFSMKDHLAARRVAFSGEVNKLVKLAAQFDQITKKLLA